ncbi:DNA/RNA helicase domain-containing protein [Paenibacillus sp.]|uniref:DNA/RNA helicase domain-containing protein n=1 Tax=Paenibacillus sp. TaxID=58172 RepID=UPI002811387A|nr:DNA/RNA helicase domain-containing protein [Paenibacillus sp.]
MIIYEATKKQFMEHVTEDSIAVKIYEAYVQKIGRTSKNEINAWNNSMNYIYKVLNTPDIPDDIPVAIEYKIPTTSRRIDFILSGFNERGESNVIIIELKQWSEMNLVEEEDGIVQTVFNRSLAKTTHPSYQAWSYARIISDYNESVQEGSVSLFPCAYLHNYIRTPDDPLTNDVYKPYLEQAPVFTKGDALRLRGFISTYIKRSDQRKALYLIENGKIKPSKSLQESLNLMLEGNEEFVMIEEQKVAYEAAIRMAKKAQETGKKQVLIIEGGPGTGKSVLAVNLLVRFTSMELVSQYVTKNSAPREVYTKKLQKNFKKSFISNMFKGSGVYYEALPNEFDTLLVDEAHRLNEKSGMFKNKGENQIMEIIRAAKLSVFFIDEHQRVSLSDIGSKEEIRRFAGMYDAEVEEIPLASQFRCNGSDGFLAWVDDVLDIRETANADGIDFEYDLQLIDDPNELRRIIFEKNMVNNKARIVAGYCWDWVTESKNNSNSYDIVIDDFQMSWNLGNTTTWAIDPDSVDQVGCIHTSQGLEFDYVGVIIGADLRYEHDRLVTDPFRRARTDKSLSGFKALYKKDPEEALKQADQIIKNTYRTLLTRGLKGCYIYCVDAGLQAYLHKRMGKMPEMVYESTVDLQLPIAAEAKSVYEVDRKEH